MIVLSMLLVLVAFAALLLGVLGVGEQPLYFVYGSIGVCLLAAVFLVTGVLRGRPAAAPRLVDHPHLPSWSGARGPAPAVPPTPAADAEHARFVQALVDLDLDSARVERLRGRFVTVERLTAASVGELTEVPGISEPLARAIHNRVRAAD